jgi:hypothetical protein
MASTHFLADNAEPITVWSQQFEEQLYAGDNVFVDIHPYSSSESKWIADKNLSIMVGCCWSGHTETWMNLLTSVVGSDPYDASAHFPHPGYTNIPGIDPVEWFDGTTAPESGGEGTVDVLGKRGTGRIRFWPSKWAPGYTAGDPLWSDILIDSDGVRYITNEVEVWWKVESGFPDTTEELRPIAIGIWDSDVTGPDASQVTGNLLYWQVIDEEVSLNVDGVAEPDPPIDPPAVDTFVQAQDMFILNAGVFKLRVL